MTDRKKGTAICWFRRDLRCDGNPALAAAARYQRIIPLYIDVSGDEGEWAPGAASNWWLHHSLQGLDRELQSRGSRLIVRKGSAHDVLSEVAAKCGASFVSWNRLYEPWAVARDKAIKSDLAGNGVAVESFNGTLLKEPWDVLKQDQTPYQVYSAYWRAFLREPIKIDACGLPSKFGDPGEDLASMSVQSLGLMPEKQWYQRMETEWTPGTAGAARALADFLKRRVLQYEEMRDVPSEVGTSRLSPHLHFGEIDPKRIWQQLERAHGPLRECADANVLQFAKELVWREFAHHLLFYFPETTDEPLRRQFHQFPWGRSQRMLQAWQRGRTGYPIVDAGMRQLWTTGWMHNRVRMIVGSFLTKDLLLSWRKGAAWFWDTLVDADLASNTFGWQWVAGCGADAAPYFRIFNPVRQSLRFDPKGTYIRQWIPELARLPDKWIHEPGNAPDEVLREAGVRLGQDYPLPIVDHGIAKKKALLAFEKIKGNGPDE